MEKELKKYLPEGNFHKVEEQRTVTMSKIRGKGNKSTEIPLQMALVRRSIKGWQKHPENVKGKPDFYFQREKIAIFVDGCFWHGCPICGHIPKTRSEFWKAKIEKNKERDIKTKNTLEKNEIKVLRFWEHNLLRNNMQHVIDEIEKTLNHIRNGQKN